MANFITATQKWVKNRIQEANEYTDRAKDDLKDIIRELSEREAEAHRGVVEGLNALSDKVSTGSLNVEGDATISGTVDAGAVRCDEVATAGAVTVSNPIGTVIETPLGVVGYSANGFSIIGSNNKITRVFMDGDRLMYDYPYDRIYTYFKPDIGCRMQYLKRGTTRFAEIVAQLEQTPTDSEKKIVIENWFNQPGNMDGHAVRRLAGNDVLDCFPATGVSFMIPESIYFTTPETYKIDSVRLLDKDMRSVKILADLSDYNVKELLVNFPFVHKAGEEMPQPTIDQVYGPTQVSTGDLYTTFPIGTSRAVDFNHKYYEMTDSDVLFHQSFTAGLIPNVILRVCDFPKDETSVIFFNVVSA